MSDTPHTPADARIAEIAASLPKLEVEALRYCAIWPNGMSPTMKPKAAEKLRGKGLLRHGEGSSSVHRGADFNFLTEDGQAVLAILDRK